MPLGKTRRIWHYSSKPDLTNVDPAYARFRQANPESLRVKHQGARPRSHWYTNPSNPEPEGLIGRNLYFTDVDADDIYDLTADPRMIVAQATERATPKPGLRPDGLPAINAGVVDPNARANIIEDLIQEAGYRAYSKVDSELGEVVQAFDPVDVRSWPSDRKVPRLVARSDDLDIVMYDPAQHTYWDQLSPDEQAALRITAADEPARVQKTGQYIGAPRGIDTPAKLQDLRARYYLQLEMGEQGVDWYHKASADLRGAAPNPEMAARTFGRTSQGANIDTNTGFGVKAHNQLQAGHPVDSGRFPGGVRESLTGAVSPSGPDFGPKLDPYSQNLRVDWSPNVGDRPVHDIWDGRAWGYRAENGKPWDAGFSEAQHRFMDQQAGVIADAANSNRLFGRDDFDHLRTQAGTWTGAKIGSGEIDPLDPAKHYGDFFDKYTTYLTRESVPGATTGHLQGMDDLTKKMYDDAVQDILYQGQVDPISREFGLMQPGVERGTGVFEGELSPGSAVEVLTGREGTPKTGVYMDPASRELIEASESTYGLLTAQDARAFNMAVAQKGVRVADFSMADVNAGRVLSEAEMRGLSGQVSEVFGDDAALALTPNGVRLLDLDGSDGKIFRDKAQKMFDEADLPDSEITFGASDTGYLENLWNTPEGRYGKAYLQDIDRPGRSNLKASFDRVAPKIAERLNELDTRFAGQHGLDLSEDILKMRQAVAKSGTEGLWKLINTGQLPAVLVAGLLGTGASLPSEEANAAPSDALGDLFGYQVLEAARRGKDLELEELDPYLPRVGDWTQTPADVAMTFGAAVSNALQTAPYRLYEAAAGNLTPDQIMEMAQEIQSFNYMPKTQGGMETMQTIGGLMQEVIDYGKTTAAGEGLMQTYDYFHDRAPEETERAMIGGEAFLDIVY